MTIFVNYTLYILLFLMLAPVKAVETVNLFKETNIFTSPAQREQLELQRRKLELGKLADDLPAKVENIEKKTKEVKLLPKIEFKGLVIKKGAKPIYWLENQNNLQYVNQFQNDIKVTGIKENSITINYKESSGITLKPSQTYVPVEKKVYEGYDFKDDIVVNQPIKEDKKKSQTIVSKDEKGLQKQLGVLGKIQKAQQILNK